MKRGQQRKRSDSGTLQRAAATVLGSAALFASAFGVGGGLAIEVAVSQLMLTRPDPLRVMAIAFLIGCVPATIFAVLGTWWMERWTFGPKQGERRSSRLRPFHTRLATALLLLGTVATWITADSLRTSRARVRVQSRVVALAESLEGRDSATEAELQQIRTLRESAEGPSLDALLELASHPSAPVRLAAGETLIHYLGTPDPDVRSRVEVLLQDDPDPQLRRRLTEVVATSYWRHPPGASREDQRNELLVAQLDDQALGVRFQAASRLPEDVERERAAAVALEVVRDLSLPDRERLQAIDGLSRSRRPEIAQALFDIVEGRYEVGFVPDEWEARFRSSAARALAKMPPQARREQPLNYRWEEAAQYSVGKVLAAQFAYKRRFGSYTSRLECLDRPHLCHPEYPPLGRHWLGPVLASGRSWERYSRRLHPGPRERTIASDTSAVASFAYTAVPVTPGRTGTRSFCGDSTGRVCYRLDGAEPRIVNGQCPHSEQAPWKGPVSLLFESKGAVPCQDFHPEALLGPADDGQRPSSDLGVPYPPVKPARGSNVNDLDSEGRTQLLRALHRGDDRLAASLLAAGADPNAVNRSGAAPLTLAVRTGRLPIVLSLLEAGADPDTPPRGGAALQEAVESEKLTLVRALLDHGADPMLQEPCGSLLHDAASRGSADVLLELLDRGVPVDAPDCSGNTALIAAARDSLDLTLLLLERGAEVDRVSDDGRTPLISATVTGELEVMNLLLDRGAAVEPDATRGSALRVAARVKRLDAIDLLIARGADPNGAGPDGVTPLMEAARAGHVEGMTRLLAAGADADLRDRGGRTALDHAREGRHPEAAASLESLAR